MAEYPDQPFEWIGSRSEWAINWALTELEEDFVYQAPYARTPAEFGGALVDFWLPNRNLVINVTTPTAQLTEQMLSSWGIRMALIDEGDALSDPMYYVQEILK